MKKLSCGGLALVVSLGSLSPSRAAAEPASARPADPAAPRACGAGGCGAGGCGGGKPAQTPAASPAAATPGTDSKCGAGRCAPGRCGGGKPTQTPAASPAAATPGTDSKCGAGRCAPGRCGAPADAAPSARQPGPTLGPDEPAALLAQAKAKLAGARQALEAEDKPRALAAFDALVGIGAALSRFDPAAVRVPEALVFGRLEALKLNALGSRSLAEGSHWRAARGSLKQLGQVFDGLYEPLGVDRSAAATGTATGPGR